MQVGDTILKINDEEATFHKQSTDLIRSLAPAPAPSLQDLREEGAQADDMGSPLDGGVWEADGADPGAEPYEGQDDGGGAARE